MQRNPWFGIPAGLRILLIHRFATLGYSLRSPRNFVWLEQNQACYFSGGNSQRSPLLDQDPASERVHAFQITLPPACYSESPRKPLSCPSQSPDHRNPRRNALRSESDLKTQILTSDIRPFPTGIFSTLLPPHPIHPRKPSRPPRPRQTPPHPTHLRQLRTHFACRILRLQPFKTIPPRQPLAAG